MKTFHIKRNSRRNARKHINSEIRKARIKRISKIYGEGKSKRRDVGYGAQKLVFKKKFDSRRKRKKHPCDAAESDACDKHVKLIACYKHYLKIFFNSGVFLC